MWTNKTSSFWPKTGSFILSFYAFASLSIAFWNCKANKSENELQGGSSWKCHHCCVHVNTQKSESMKTMWSWTCMVHVFEGCRLKYHKETMAYVVVLLLCLLMIHQESVDLLHIKMALPYRHRLLRRLVNATILRQNLCNKNNNSAPIVQYKSFFFTPNNIW